MVLSVKLPNLKLKTWPKQLSLVDIALPVHTNTLAYFARLKLLRKLSCANKPPVVQWNIFCQV